MCQYRADTSCLNTFGLVMGALTLVVTIANIVLIFDMAIDWGAEFGLLFAVFTIIYGAIGFCNFWFGRRKAQFGDEEGLHVCILVLFMILLPVAIIWSWYLSFVAIILNAFTGDENGTYLAIYLWYVNLIFGITLMITSWFTCLKTLKPQVIQTTTVVQMQATTGPGAV